MAQSDPQIIFPQFKLEWFSVMGFRGGGDGQQLKLTFKDLSDKPIKYITVKYYAINSVGDPESDNFGRKEFSVKCTGPYTKNKTNKLGVDIALFHPNLLKALPHNIEIIYMDDTLDDIDINDDNIDLYFPDKKKTKGKSYDDVY